MFYRVTAPHDLTISVVAYFYIVCISAYHHHRHCKQHSAEHISAFSIFPHINYALGISSQERDSKNVFSVLATCYQL